MTREEFLQQFEFANGRWQEKGVKTPHAQGSIDWKQVFEHQLAEAKIQFETEVKFHDTRKWRFDYVVKNSKVAIEYQGFVGVAGNCHSSKDGILRDYEKANEAQLAGYLVLKITYRDVKDGNALKLVRRALKKESSLLNNKLCVTMPESERLVTDIRRTLKGLLNRLDTIE